MSIKIAQKWFHKKNDRLWYLYKNCLRLWEIWANYLLPKALKSGPKSNKLSNLVTLLFSSEMFNYVLNAKSWPFFSAPFLRLRLRRRAKTRENATVRKAEAKSARFPLVRVCVLKPSRDSDWSKRLGENIKWTCLQLWLHLLGIKVLTPCNN